MAAKLTVTVYREELLMAGQGVKVGQQRVKGGRIAVGQRLKCNRGYPAVFLVTLC